MSEQADLDADQDDDDHLLGDHRDGAAVGDEAVRAVDPDVDALPSRRASRPVTSRVAWRIGSAAAVVLAVIAVVLLVRALAVPGSTEITVKPVPIAASAAAARQSTGTRTGSREADASSPVPSDPATSIAAEDSTRPGAMSSTEPPGTTSPASGGVVLVHVAGAVRRPGVVRLPAGSRIADAVAAAGGALPGAAVDAVNLAARVEDGTQIRVPAAGEQVPSAGSPPPGAGAATSAAPPATSGAGAGGAPSGSSSAPVNINTADAVALDALPRVGPVMAQRIVAWRTEHGPFGSVDDLDAVPGIGEKMMAELRPLVTTG
ncbi:ComEA family DNA-binding protein [Tersicoccus sp. Bi-70]|uniref:ComEA family DNA-binding protein n=1 Tax=Tersicoccus sp. Bi-70 TaxID=1897634 RepID=UPI0018E984D6|nr:helix-hairpin-helix domain-containing protein [Tersicoccus sp. Bi-70]